MSLRIKDWQPTKLSRLLNRSICPKSTGGICDTIPTISEFGQRMSAIQLKLLSIAFLRAAALRSRGTRAAFSALNATVEGIEYIEDRRLDKKHILRFATCNYIDEGRHIILKGASGNGKTYLACALGNAACRKFKKVRYIRTPELLDELSISKANGELKSTISAYAKLDLLILDEWLIRRLSYNEAYDLLEIVEARRERS